MATLDEMLNHTRARRARLDKHYETFINKLIEKNMTITEARGAKLVSMASEILACHNIESDLEDKLISKHVKDKCNE